MRQPTRMAVPGIAPGYRRYERRVGLLHYTAKYRMGSRRPESNGHLPRIVRAWSQSTTPRFAAPEDAARPTVAYEMTEKVVLWVKTGWQPRVAKANVRSARKSPCDGQT